MSEGRTLNASIAVDCVHVIVGGQNHNRDQCSINCAALTLRSLSQL